jgi:hypothetical protein
MAPTPQRPNTCPNINMQWKSLHNIALRKQPKPQCDAATNQKRNASENMEKKSANA